MSRTSGDATMKKANGTEMFSRKDALQAGKFIAAIVVLFLFFGFVFSLFPLEWFEGFFASATLWFLKLLGFKGVVVAGEPVLVYLDSFAAPLGFSYLCTGILELTIVWSAVLASFGIDLRKRLIGVAAAAIVLVAFNFARIISSILIIAWLGLDAGNFSHDILFRVFLFVVIAGFYYVWFGWATKKAH